MSIELWCLFFAGLLHLFSKAPLAYAQNQQAGGYDNKNPREQQAALSDWGKRAMAAHQNQLESFPLFAAGVLVATFTNNPSSIIAYLSVAHVVARVLYIVCYLQGLSTLRSVVWSVGILSALALLCSPAWI